MIEVRGHCLGDRISLVYQLCPPNMSILFLQRVASCLVGKNNVMRVSNFYFLLLSKPLIFCYFVPLNIRIHRTVEDKCYPSINKLIVYDVVHLDDVFQFRPISTVTCELLSTFCNKPVKKSVLEAMSPSCSDMAVFKEFGSKPTRFLEAT